MLSQRPAAAARTSQRARRCRSRRAVHADADHADDAHDPTARGRRRANDAARVAVLGGGRSSEHEVSLASAASVRGGLERGGHEVRRGRGRARRHVARTTGEELALAPGRGLLGADVVFPVLHGPFGEDGTVQGLLECLDVPYVGAGVLASAVCMDKVVSKELMARAGLPQVDYRGVRHARWAAARDAVLADLAALGLPVFVKPARLGSSVGIVRVADADELAGALETAFAHDPLVIVEAAARGLEVECAVLGNERADRLRAGRDRADRRRGTAGTTTRRSTRPAGWSWSCPARISATARERVQRARGRGLRAARLRRPGARRLLRGLEREQVLVNELNTMPGFTETSVYGKLFAASGVPYEELLDRLIALALARHARERAYQF